MAIIILLMKPSYVIFLFSLPVFNQMFSRIADALHRQSAMTIQELLELITSCYSPSPEAEQLQFLYDVSGWLEPHIARIKNQVYPHSFKFAKDNSGKVGMWYKKWAKDTVWLPEKGPLYILKSIPRDIPPMIRPNSQKMPKIEDMKSKVTKCACRMSTQQIAWWTAFINREEKFRKKWDNLPLAALRTLKADRWRILSLRKHFSQNEIDCDRTVDVEEQHMEEQLNKLLSKQDHFPQVKNGYLVKIEPSAWLPYNVLSRLSTLVVETCNISIPFPQQ